jgi:hypothetical protein
MDTRFIEHIRAAVKEIRTGVWEKAQVPVAGSRHGKRVARIPLIPIRWRPTRGRCHGKIGTRSRISPVSRIFPLSERRIHAIIEMHLERAALSRSGQRIPAVLPILSRFPHEMSMIR